VFKRKGGGLLLWMWCLDGVLKVGKAGKAAGKGKRVESGVQEKRRGFVTGWGVEGGEGWQGTRERDSLHTNYTCHIPLL
jgi:hypothetical protein